MTDEITFNGVHLMLCTITFLLRFFLGVAYGYMSGYERRRH